MAAVIQWDPDSDTAIRSFREDDIDVPCLIPWRFLFIQEHTKKTFACPYHRCPSGDLAAASLEEIWNGAEAQAMRRALLQKTIPLYCLNHSAACPLIHKARAAGYTQPAPSSLEMGVNDYWAMGTGWFPLEYVPDAVRWCGAYADFCIDALDKRELRLEVVVFRPGLEADPIKGALHLDGELVSRFEVASPGWQDVSAPLVVEHRRDRLKVALVVDNPWIPAQCVPGNADARLLGVAVRRIWTF
jgi:hypothetical protein